MRRKATVRSAAQVPFQGDVKQVAAMNTSTKMHKEDRCAQNLSLLQEDALIGLMFDE